MGGANRTSGLRNRGLKAETLIDEHDVVVDRLWDADHGDLLAAFANCPGDSLRAPQRAVASNDEQNIDVHPLQTVNNFFWILFTARRAKNGPSVLVDARHPRRREVEHGALVFGDESLVPVAEAVN